MFGYAVRVGGAFPYAGLRAVDGTGGFGFERQARGRCRVWVVGAGRVAGFAGGAGANSQGGKYLIPHGEGFVVG